jgi:hypothetical protein
MRAFSTTAGVFLVLIAIGSAMTPMTSAQKTSNLPVTSTIADGTFQIQSDDIGPYTNSKAVQSVIQPVGDWVLDTHYSLLSTRSVWFDFSRPVGVPAAPFVQELVKARLITQCPTYGNSMLSLKNDGKTIITCGLVIGFDYGGNKYRLAMNPLGPNDYGETNAVNVSCTAGPADGPCTQWNIVPEATGGNIARLVLVSTKGKPVEKTLGNFYFSFSITVTNP